MILMAQIFAVSSVLYLANLMLFPLLKPASKKQKQRIRQYAKEREKEQRKKKRLQSRRELIRKYGEFMLTDVTRSEIGRILVRLDKADVLPEEIRLKQITYAAYGAALTAVTFIVSPLFGYVCILFTVLLFMLPRDKLNRELKRKEENISRDFPAFYSMVYYQYARSVNIYLADIIKDYLPNASEDLAKELGVILDNIDYGEEYALREFKKRVQVHYVAKFCDIMETRLRGYDNTSQMLYFKNEIDAFRMQTLEKELAKRKSQNTKLQLVLIIVLAVYVMAYFLYSVLSALRLFQ